MKFIAILLIIIIQLAVINSKDWKDTHRFERASSIWKEIIKKAFTSYSNNKGGYNRTAMIKDVDYLKRLIHHAILIYTRKIKPTEKFYHGNYEDTLITTETVSDTETNKILYTGLSPSQSNIFDIRFGENYRKLGKDIIDWLFHLTVEDEANCVYHFPLIPASENGCSFIALNPLPPFTPLTDTCEYTNSVSGWSKFFFYYITNDLITIIKDSSTVFGGLVSLLYMKGTLELPRTTLICLFARSFYGIIVLIIIVDVTIFLVVTSFIIIFIVCSVKIFGNDKTKKELNRFEIETDKSYARDLDIIRKELVKNKSETKKIAKAVKKRNDSKNLIK